MLKAKKLSLLAFILLMFVTQSCINEENFFQKSEQKVENDYFDFSTKKTVQLNINYGYEGYNVLFEIYAENPLNEYDLKKSDVNPIFTCFTDASSSFSGNVEVPSYATNLYLYSTDRGVIGCVKMPIDNLKASYIYTSPKEQVATRAAMTPIEIGKNAKKIDSNYKWFSLYNVYDYNSSVVFEPSNKNVKALYQTVPAKTKLTDESTLGELLQRIRNALRKGNDNSKFAANEKALNLTIREKSDAGNLIKGAHFDLTLLGGNGSFHNALAYYYYKTGSNPTAEDIKNLPKFFIFPRITTNKPSMPIKVRLQFFGEKGTDVSGTDFFPTGYTVGWMLVSNLFPNLYYPSASITTIERKMNEAYEKNQTIFSNPTANFKQQLGCISLFDKKSQRIVFGFEDQAFGNESDKSFDDLLFYVDSDPVEAVINPDRPEMPTLDDDIYVTEVTKGTLAFEDIWPSGGDYDMNDVIIEYESEVTFNQANSITKIIDRFKPVNPKESASNNNAFGYVIENNVGTIDKDKSTIHATEEGNQLILCPNVKNIVDQNKVFTVVRTFAPGVSKMTYKRNYNPFIVMNYKAGEKKRKEVHLPKHKLTPWGDNALIGTSDDAFFIHKEGIFPFAIDIPAVRVKPVTEKFKIGSANEYPRFNSWAKSKGKVDADWYLTKDK